MAKQNGWTLKHDTHHDGDALITATKDDRTVTIKVAGDVEPEVVDRRVRRILARDDLVYADRFGGQKDARPALEEAHAEAVAAERTQAAGAAFDAPTAAAQGSGTED